MACHFLTTQVFDLVWGPGILRGLIKAAHVRLREFIYFVHAALSRFHKFINLQNLELDPANDWLPMLRADAGVP